VVGGAGGHPRGGRRRAAIEKSIVATGRGDDGTTGLLYGGRVRKDDPRTEAYGTIDEAVAALGLARAELRESTRGASGPEGMESMAELLLSLQRGLFVVGAELAAGPGSDARLKDGVTRVSEAMLADLEATLADHETRITMPREFVVPGETRLSAALEVARTVLRRAERRAVALGANGVISGDWLVPYLNRLADLLWILARAAEQAEQRAPSLARTAPRARRRAGPADPAAGDAGC
jgi:cob(I)alamin adenosyltransferase